MESQQGQPPLTPTERARIDELRSRLAGLPHSSFRLQGQADRDALARARVRRVIRAIKPHVTVMSADNMHQLLAREGGSSPEEEKVSRELIAEVRAGGGWALFFKVPEQWAEQLGEKAGSYMMAGPISTTRGEAYRVGIDALGRTLAVELPQLGGAAVPEPKTKAEAMADALRMEPKIKAEAMASALRMVSTYGKVAGAVRTMSTGTVTPEGKITMDEAPDGGG